MHSISLSNLKGDISGGISSAIVSLPGNIVFGLIAFAPLGNAYMAQGILAGMYCSIFAGLCAAVFGSTPAMISGPKAPVALIFSAVIIQLFASPHIHMIHPDRISVVLALAFIVVFMGGIFQVSFGLMRFGNLIKFIPYPVIAGFLNGTSILIILSQIWTFLGIPKQSSLYDLISSLGLIMPLNMLIVLFAALVMWHASKITKKIPASILSLVLGSLLYYSLMALGLGRHLGQTIGLIPVKAPSPEYLLEFLSFFSNMNFVELLPILLPAAFGIAMLSSIDSLLTSVSMQSLTNKRSDANRELFAQGIGNMVSASFGGLAGAGFVARSKVNYQAGGRTRLSGVISSIVVLLIILLFSSLFGMIPNAVMTGIVLAVAIQIVDKWSLQLLKDIFSPEINQKKELLHSFLVIILVMFATVFFNLIIAVGLGMGVSILLFVMKISTSVIRHSYRGSTFHSKNQRAEKLIELLCEHGGRICVLELEGSIFFGSADNLAKEIDRLSDEGVRYFILDMKRLNEIDSTGARILQQIYHQLRNKKKHLAISYLKKESPPWHLLNDMGVIRIIGAENLFWDTDLALEYFEDQLLAEISGTKPCNQETYLSDFQALKGLGNEELTTLQRMLEKRQYEKGETVFKEGDKDNALYFITKGAADVTITVPDTNHKKRLQTFSSGTIFGEMALLDAKPRSANVEAREGLVCYRLTMEDFIRLEEMHPQISITILTNISKIMAARLRLANEMVIELER